MKKRTISFILALTVTATTVAAMPVAAYANSDEVIEATEVVLSEEEDQVEEITEEAEIEEIEELEVIEETEEIVVDEIEEVETEETVVKVVSSIEEVAAASQAADNQAFYTVEASTASEQNEVIEALNDTGLYEAVEGSNNNVEVVAVYSNMRLRLTAAASDSIQAYGATEAIYFEDHYIFSYATEEETMNAYEMLAAEYGENNVFIDYPLSAEAISWGTTYMNMDAETKKAPANGEQVIVAVLDTGINASHSIFAGTKILTGYNVLNGTTNVSDTDGHGTAVAGIIAESTPANVAILPIKVMSDSQNGSTEDLMNAIAYASKQGADIINMSLGGSIGGSNTYFKYMDRVISKYDQLIVCSSGNENVNADAEMVVPGALTSTVSVGAINNSGIRSTFSNYGASVDFAAPGQGVRVAYSASSNTYSSASGTSFAAPHVSAAAALIKAENPGYTKNDIKNALIKASTDLGTAGKDAYYGNGCPKFQKTATVAAASKSASTTAIKAGWQKINGEWYYLKADGNKLTNAWAKDSTGWCWLGADGKITKNRWIKDNGEWYFLKANGYMAANEWAKDSTGWCWMASNGKITKNQWIKDNGEWYFLKANGYMAANEWAKDSTGWCWMASNGKITKNQWIKDNGEWYFLKANGYMAANEWAKDSTNTYWMGSNGKIAYAK